MHYKEITSKTCKYANMDCLSICSSCFITRVFFVLFCVVLLVVFFWGVGGVYKFVCVF